MNLNASLFRSWHAAVAAAAVAGFVAWKFKGEITPGRHTAGSDRLYLLASGWGAFVLFLVVYAYALRKYIHKMGISPEFGMKASDQSLERAITRLNDVRRKIVAGVIGSRKDALELARNVLREEGVRKIIRVRVADGPPGGPPFLLVDSSTEPLGRMAKWMHAHLFYGVAAAVLVGLHGGARFASPMGILLDGLSSLVVATGLVGIVLWALGPAWLTRAERDLSIEQAFGLDRNFADKVDFALNELDPEARAILADLRRSRGGTFVEKAKSALETLARAEAESRQKFQNLVALLGQERCVKRELSQLQSLRAWINGWRLVHIPASIVLGGAVLAHVISVWWY